MAYYFNESYYIHCKLAQLKSIGQNYTEQQLLAAFSRDGLTPQQHYEQFGRTEGLNPNPYFNEYEYLYAKAEHLRSTGEPNPYGDGDWTPDQALAFILSFGMTPAQYYEHIGCYEKSPNGSYINPSNAFDANAYWMAKLLECRQSGETVNGHTGNAITLDDMLLRFQNDGLSPVSHYPLYGAAEVDQFTIPFVQTVPIGQRVPNDPMRDDIGDIVPTNYMANTSAPSNSRAQPVPKPADVGNLVTDETISPTPVYPEKSAPVRWDDDYIRPPNTIKDGFGVNILPPTTTGTGYASDHWIVVDDNSDTGIVMDRNTGRVLGEVDLVKTVVNGRIVAVMPEWENLPENWLEATDRNDLPPGVAPNFDLLNNFIKDPVADTTGIMAAFNAADDLLIFGTVKKTGSSVSLDEDGNMSWTGYHQDAVKPAQALADGQYLNANGTAEVPEGSGLLVLTSAKTGWHYINGSLVARNHIIAQDGARLHNIVGGHADDSITVAQGAISDSILDSMNGADTITIHGQVEAIQSDPIDGLEGAADVVTIVGGGIGAGGIVDNFIFTGYGNDTINIETGATVGGRIMGGLGDDVINLGAGAHTLWLEDTDGNNVVNLAAAGSGLTLPANTKFSGTIKGGAGADTFTINNNATVTGTVDTGDGMNEISILGSLTGSISTGTDFDFISISGGTVTGNINAGDGNDVINITAGSTVGGIITPGKGADDITLFGGARDLAIASGDTGAYAFNVGMTTFSTTLCDVIVAPGAGTALLLGGGWGNGPVTGENAFTAVGDNTAVLFSGTYNDNTLTFTAGAGGPDLLLAYDANPAGGDMTIQAVVLTGTAGLTASTVDGDITFA